MTVGMSSLVDSVPEDPVEGSTLAPVVQRWYSTVPGEAVQPTEGRWEQRTSSTRGRLSRQGSPALRCLDVSCRLGALPASPKVAMNPVLSLPHSIPLSFR
jgi:hypothetical protein